MASITDFLDNYPYDMFDKWSHIQEQLDKQLGGIDTVLKSFSDCLSRFDSQVVDYSSILSKVFDNYEKQMSAFRKIEPKVLSAMSKLSDDISFWDTFENLSGFISRLEMETVDSLSKLSSAEILEQINNLTIVIPSFNQQINNISDTKENNTPDKRIETVVSEKTKLSAENINLYLGIIASLIGILTSLIGLFFSGASEINISIGNDYSTNYYIAEANNYYINNLEIDAGLCNNTGFRFVAEKEIKPRIKADCSSAVVDTLTLGKIVQIVDKYKKWVQICWQNEDGTYSYGWIQNYKLAEFK